MKKTLLKALACALALLPLPSFQPLAMMPKVSVKTIAVSNQYVDIKLAYPEVSGMADETFQTLFNANVKNDMNQLVSQLELDAKDAYDSAASGGYRYLKYTLSSFVQTFRCDGTVLSFSDRPETYTGGAHPNNDARFYALLNKPAGRQLTLPQLFSDPAQGKARVDKFINKAIEDHPDDYFPDATASAGDSTWFYLTKGSLCVVFPSYSIAPYVAGEPEFELPLSSLKAILMPEIY